MKKQRKHQPEERSRFSLGLGCGGSASGLATIRPERREAYPRIGRLTAKCCHRQFAITSRLIGSNLAEGRGVVDGFRTLVVPLFPCTTNSNQPSP